jgi:hypothetical protein
VTQQEILLKIEQIDQAILRIASGQAVVEIVFGDKSQRFAEANLGELKAIRDSLYGQLPASATGQVGPRRAPIGFWF